jgi:DNA-binding response OmpR family regulator
MTRHAAADGRLSATSGKRVLVVDDDQDIRTVLQGVLQRAGFEVRSADTARGAMRTLFETPVDLVVLDLGLPDLDGLDVLARIREMTDIPVLLLTARAREDDKVSGLLAGADDYLTKPFGNRELVARCISLLRRATPGDGPHELLDDGTVRIDLARRQVTVDSRVLALSPTDWSLLVAFVQRPDRVLSAEQLLELAWNDPLGIGPERVKFAVLRLRRRLGWHDPATSPIQSVRGFGYRYRPHPQGTDAHTGS